MSTILKALRRLEEDRSAQSERPLREEVTRGSGSARPRRGRWPLLIALLGLGVAAGAGALAYWVLGRAPDPAQPTEMAAAGAAEPRGEPAAAPKRPRRPRAARPARKGSVPSPAAAPSAAPERELPAAALASKVELMKRPPAEPRIAEPEPAEPLAAASTSGAQPGRLDPEEIPGRHKRPVSRSSRSGSEPAPSIAEGAEAPEPPSEALVVAVAPEPARGLPEPPAASRATPARDTGRETAAPGPEPTDTKAAAEGSSKQPAKPAAAMPSESQPAAAGSSEIARAEVPGLRVESTVWHPLAERRVATIEFDETSERRQVREGDAVGPLVVSKIEPSAVVFVHDGVELRRRIGE